ncbi:MAG TPA: hypothetical protein VGJ15_02945, partial [Pirellulales bacterium]
MNRYWQITSFVILCAIFALLASFTSTTNTFANEAIVATQPPASQHAALAELRVFPASVNLNTSAGRQSIIVQAVYADDLTRDVTAEAKFTPADADLLRLENNVVFPAADGQTEIKIEYGGKSVSVPVAVKEAKTERPISFRLDVMPVFARAGCNTGSCHG